MDIRKIAKVYWKDWVFIVRIIYKNCEYKVIIEINDKWYSVIQPYKKENMELLKDIYSNTLLFEILTKIKSL